MLAYKPGTWITFVVKEHLLDLKKLQASVLAPFACVTLLRPFFPVGMEGFLRCA